MDLEAEVKEAMAALVNTGFVKKVIQEQLQKTIKEIVSSAINGYGDFSKALQKKMTEALGVDLKGLGLPNYNQLVCNWVREIVDGTFMAMGKAQIEENLKEFFKPLEKTEWKITEIIEEFKKSIREEDRSNAEDEIAFSIERDGHWTYFYFDEKKKDRKYACKHRVGVSDGHIFTVNINGNDGDKVKFDHFYGFEGFLFKLYAAKAAIIDDGDDVDTYMGEAD